jgi:hypothetical protein
VITELNRQIGIVRPTLPYVDANMTIYFQRGKPSYVSHAWLSFIGQFVVTGAEPSSTPTVLP